MTMEMKYRGTPVDSLARDELVLLCKMQQKQLERLREKSCGHKQNIREMQAKLACLKAQVLDLRIIRPEVIEKEVQKITGSFPDVNSSTLIEEEARV